MRDNEFARRVAERISEELAGLRDTDQRARLEALLEQYHRRVMTGDRLGARLAEQRAALEDLGARLAGELEGMHERLREAGVEERVARLGEVAASLREAVVAAHQDDLRERTVDSEQEIVRRQLEVLEMALPALREAERRELVEAVHRAIRAREVALEGRRDREARAIRERSPGREDLIEILVFAEGVYREFGDHERAERLSHLTEALWGGHEGRHRPHAGPDREQARHDLEVMEVARHALREAGRRDAADLLSRAIHARAVELEGVRGREAEIARDEAPPLAEQVELLRFAADLWREFGNLERSELVDELADRLWSHPADRARPRHESGEHRQAVQERLERLERRLGQIAEVLAAARRELRELHELLR